jgi:hypothetical protein
MEIKELESFYVNEASQTLDVTFRILSDSEDEIRTDQITLEEVKTFGYNITENVDDFYDEEDDDDIYLFGDIDNEDLDEQEVISFLNEYYLIYPDNLPDAELY